MSTGISFSKSFHDATSFENMIIWFLEQPLVLNSALEVDALCAELQTLSPFGNTQNCLQGLGLGLSIQTIKLMSNLKSCLQLILQPWPESASDCGQCKCHCAKVEDIVTEEDMEEIAGIHWKSHCQAYAGFIIKELLDSCSFSGCCDNSESHIKEWSVDNVMIKAGTLASMEERSMVSNGNHNDHNCINKLDAKTE